MALAASPGAARAQPPAADPLAPLLFLVGDWTAVDSPPGEHGAFAFSLAAQNRVMMRTSFASYDAAPGRAPSRHDDVMIIFSEGGALRAEYFDSEGHIIRYDVTAPRARDVVFHAAPTANEPGYRLSYSLLPERLLKGRFEISPPGDRETFKPYLSWTARRAVK